MALQRCRIHSITSARRSHPDFYDKCKPGYHIVGDDFATTVTNKMKPGLIYKTLSTRSTCTNLGSLLLSLVFLSLKTIFVIFSMSVKLIMT